jgi:hypothetical protein
VMRRGKLSCKDLSGLLASLDRKGDSLESWINSKQLLSEKRYTAKAPSIQSREAT